MGIGIVPVACGGSVRNGDEGNDSGSGGSSSTSGGTKSRAGTTSRSGSGTGGSGKMLPPTGGAGGGISCSAPKLDTLTGLVTCSEGYKHRPQRVDCEGFGGLPQEPDASAGAGGVGEPPVKQRATRDVVCGDDYYGDGAGSGTPPGEEICDQFVMGFCRDSSDGFEEPTCDSGCYSDADCGPAALCECGHAESPSGGVCVDAACFTDAACGPGNLCASGYGTCGEYGYACFAADDECRTGADCESGSCTLSGSRRSCDDSICGRPFLVESAARFADVVSGHDWNGDGRAPRVTHLTAEERACLAQHWSRLGQLEHASIAAFARFSLQLLSLGAPPELVEACTAALADETAHTQLCFGIASAYAGRDVGPGPLDISGSLNVASLDEVVALVIAEGCFGETLAALEALEAAETAADPVIRDAYTRIARDEQRHAELAFRFVRWALGQDRASVSDCIDAALHTAEARPDVLRAVIEPCFAALLAQAA
jgi:hypothetical protein